MVLAMVLLQNDAAKLFHHKPKLANTWEFQIEISM